GMDRADWPSGPGARRLVHVPAGDASGAKATSRYDDLRNISEDELEAFTDYNLEKGLAGDLGAANRVVHAHRRCASAPRSLVQIENQVQTQQRRYRQWAARGGNDRGFPSEQELREQLTRQFESCRFMDSMFTPDLRRQLEEMAERGHVTARYLYALWPPETFGRADAFLRQQEWAERALAYTLANLTAGETAGLLAFGQSYANNGTFTARDRYLGTAFIIAALDCGLELDYYANYINGFLSSERFAGTADDPRDEVLVMADGLKGFCR
ncbi:MAG: hypothetical protein HKN58_02390, partial [Xanthomonadales bacterium]|nr:hypothetical protein [Xanthomonadales bacterium]